MEQNRFEIFVDYERQLIHYHHKGMLKVEEIGEVWQKLLEMEEFTKLGYNLLTDYSDADFAFSINKTDIIWNFLLSIKHILKGKKEAVITSKPIPTAISILFESETNKSMGFQVKTFTTMDAALEWLK
jgi:hypothetical protein